MEITKRVVVCCFWISILSYCCTIPNPSQEKLLSVQAYSFISYSELIVWFQSHIKSKRNANERNGCIITKYNECCKTEYILHEHYILFLSKSIQLSKNRRRTVVTKLSFQTNIFLPCWKRPDTHITAWKLFICYFIILLYSVCW